ncbi:MAG: glycosyltransferase [Bacteroidota bacterium]|nr:glycosyltransferase [Bacteroidota bacterium]MDP4212001.1 glycosyltransferase [Bacteroidota bacterium]MDP4249937.1 glycosyltransferase [Bacteroidota bacterium]
MKKSSRSFDFLLLIPFFNNREGLVQSLRTVDYDPGKCAVPIIDDGSSEPLNADALLREANTALNIEIIRLSVNQGIANALNEGLDFLAKRDDYNYIARLDCGDICSKHRFVEQVKYLDAHPGIDLLGSWCTFEDPGTGSSYLYKTPVQPDGITRGMEIIAGLCFRRRILSVSVLYAKLKIKISPMNRLFTTGIPGKYSVIKKPREEKV